MDKPRFCPCKLRWDGPTHLGKIIDDVCFLVCASSHRIQALPVAYHEVECRHCLLIMKKQKLPINTVCELRPI